MLIRERAVYNILDLIGDVGGLIDGIGYITSAILFLFSLFTQNPIAQYFLASIFTLKE